MCHMVLKLWYFYMLMEKPLGHYFQVLSSKYQAAQCNQKICISISSRLQVRSKESEQGRTPILITATTSVSQSQSQLINDWLI